MIHENFDRVFVINLAKSKDRRSTTKKRLEDKLGMIEGEHYDFWKATSGSSKFAKFSGNKYQGWNRNAAGLVYTTKRLIEKAKKEKWKNIFIMEDDVDFINNFGEVYKEAIRHLPDNFDFFHLNSTHEKPTKWHSGVVHKLKGAWCCQAYAVNESMYDLYLEELKESRCPIDEMTLNFQKTKDNSYCVVPNIVYHHANKPSDIRGRIVEY